MKRRNMVLFTWYVGEKGKTGSAPIFGMVEVFPYNISECPLSTVAQKMPKKNPGLSKMSNKQ